MKRPPVIRAFLGDEIIADSFAGGGGASSGIELALGRSPDVAINHDDEAIAMHAANHPTTRHYTESVWEVDPRAATGGKPVALAWFSPDCKHHSKAKGGKPREQKIRGLAWVAITWAHRVKPRVIALENVEEFRDWGPLHRVGPKAGQPIAARKGETFRAFVRKLERLGYVVEHRLLRACDYGAPTTRRRLFLVARCDGRPIAWPTPTHGPLAKPYRTAAEVIDWDLPCPSIFDRERPLADKTLARIARGIRKFVLESGRPFIVPQTHGDKHGNADSRTHSIDEPLRTITTLGAQYHLAVPYLVHRSNGERVGQAPRIYNIAKPLGVVVAQGQKHALCAAFLAKHYGGNESTSGGSAMTRAMDTITAQDHHSLVAAHLVRYNGDRAGAERVADIAEPLGTQDTSRRYALVASFLSKYQGTSTGSSMDAPVPTVTASGEHLAVVTVTIDGEEYVIVDIGMRMLTPRELFRAQGFADDYRIDPPGPDGKPLTKTAQIRMCGNSVCPPIAAAIVRAQFSEAA